MRRVYAVGAAAVVMWLSLFAMLLSNDPQTMTRHDSFPAHGESTTFVVHATPRPLANVTCRFSILAWADLISVSDLPAMIQATEQCADDCVALRTPWTVRWFGLHRDPDEVPCPATPPLTPISRRKGTYFVRYRNATCHETRRDNVQPMYMFETNWTIWTFWRVLQDHDGWKNVIASGVVASVFTILACTTAGMLYALYVCERQRVETRPPLKLKLKSALVQR